jgi:hypothetical protein
MTLPLQGRGRRFEPARAHTSVRATARAEYLPSGGSNQGASVVRTRPSSRCPRSRYSSSVSTITGTTPTTGLIARSERRSAPREVSRSIEGPLVAGSRGPASRTTGLWTPPRRIYGTSAMYETCSSYWRGCHRKTPRLEAARARIRATASAPGRSPVPRVSKRFLIYSASIGTRAALAQTGRALD